MPWMKWATEAHGTLPAVTGGAAGSPSLLVQPWGLTQAGGTGRGRPGPVLVVGEPDGRRLGLPTVQPS